MMCVVMLVCVCSVGCFHVIGQVYNFICVLPYPTFFQSSHVECGPASCWSHLTRRGRPRFFDGRMLEGQAAEEVLYVACVGEHSLAEQPHTATHEHTIGPPSQVMFNANEHATLISCYPCAHTIWPGFELR